MIITVLFCTLVPLGVPAVRTFLQLGCSLKVGSHAASIGYADTTTLPFQVLWADRATPRLYSVQHALLEGIHSPDKLLRFRCVTCGGPAGYSLGSLGL